MEPLYIYEDLYVEFLNTRDSADDSYLNSGTCTYTLYAVTTVSGAEVETAVSSGTGTLSYVAASNGIYRGTIESTITATLTVGAKYRVRIVFVQGAYNSRRKLDYRAMERGRN